MHIDHERGFAFIHIPKTGGTSVIRALAGDQVPIDHGIAGSEHASELLRACFVRDPLTRFVSAFRYSVQLSLRKDGKFVSDKHPVRELIASQHLTDINTFAREAAQRGPEWLFQNIHFRPQIEWLSHGRPQFIGRFEAMDRDFARLCMAVGVPVPRLGRHRVAKKKLDAAPTDETTALIADWYAEDYRFLGY